MTEKIGKVFDFTQNQLRALIATHPDRFPMYTRQGRWVFDGESWTNWCEGFLGGQLWLLYQHTRQPWWQEKAVHYSRLIEARKTDRNVHDLGFLYAIFPAGAGAFILLLVALVVNNLAKNRRYPEYWF